MAGPGRRAVAGRARALRILGGRVRGVSALAARRYLAAAADHVAGAGGCGRADLLGRQCGFHDLSGAPARRRRQEKGDLQAQPPGGVHHEPADHGLGRSRGGLTTRLHLGCEQGQRPLSIVLTAGQRGDSPQFAVVLDGIGFRGWAVAGPVPGPIRSWPTRPTPHARTGGTCAGEGSRRPSPARPIRTPIDASKGPGAAGHRPSTLKPTSSATPWSVASTGSNATAPWPPATTSSPCATRPLCRLPRSTNGYDPL